MAFEYFARAGVDVAVIETGLGGRLDSTNVIDPIAAGVTTIDYDHTEYLGDTLEQIAAEKAGIFKPGRPAVVGERDRVAARAARARCAQGRCVGGAHRCRRVLDQRRRDRSDWHDVRSRRRLARERA